MSRTVGKTAISQKERVALRIDGARLMERLEELARRGARDDGGVHRLAFTDAHDQRSTGRTPGSGER